MVHEQKQIKKYYSRHLNQVKDEILPTVGSVLTLVMIPLHIGICQTNQH